MARRGEKLREHILYAAKDVFLDVGFERATMDMIAARAETSKRTLYAHFESKENLFLAVIELVRGLFLGKLKTPSDYPGEPAEALTLFCGRFLESLLYERTIRMCRLCMAEADRFPEGAARYYDVVFSVAQERLGKYLNETFGISAEESLEGAQALLGLVLYPRFLRALFGMDALSDRLEEEGIRAEFDLRSVHEAVTKFALGYSPVAQRIELRKRVV